MAYGQDSPLASILQVFHVCILVTDCVHSILKGGQGVASFDFRYKMPTPKHWSCRAHSSLSVWVVSKSCTPL